MRTRESIRRLAMWWQCPRCRRMNRGTENYCKCGHWRWEHRATNQETDNADK